MKRQEILERRQQRLLAKKNELLKRSKESEDVAEVRAINEKLQDIADQLQDVQDELQAIMEEEGTGNDTSGGSGTEEGTGEENRATEVKDMTEVRNASIVGAFGQKAAPEHREKQDRYDTTEYRTVFMNFVCRGVPISEEYRANEVTATADVSAVIPTSIMNEIIRKMESYGNLYAKVRKLNVQGGVRIPIVTLKPKAKWVTENNPSDDQKGKADESVTFSYHTLECKIAQTLLASITTLDVFQKTFVELATEAMVQAIDEAIVNGTGEDQPLGITKDARVPAENVITMTEDEVKTWSGWHRKVKAKMKKSYRNGCFIMNQSTFDGDIDGMVDANGQPIGRTNYGINNEETYRFMGKDVETVEDSVLPSWDDADAGDVVAIFTNLNDYAFNSNLKMQVVKWTDHDANKLKNKCILICDAKLADANGTLIIKKGADSSNTSDKKNEDAAG